MNRLRRSVNCAALGAVVLILSAAHASAAMVCKGKAGWHAHAHEECRYRGRPVAVFYADDWRWGRTDQYQWRREHGVRGYLHGNKLIWIER
jgi:hypothetical protein